MGATGAGDERNHDRRAGEARDSAEGFDALPPDLLEAMRQIGATGRASLGAAGDTAKALRTLVVFLSRHLGWSWSAAMLVPALLSVVAAAIAGWFAMRYFEHTRLQATRRQLARLGIGELADFMPDPQSPESARAASARNPPGNGQGTPAKDEQGIDLTPP